MREAWKTLLSPTGLAWLQPALPCPPRAAFPVSQGGARAMQVSQARPATLPLHPARPPRPVQTTFSTRDGAAEKKGSDPCPRWRGDVRVRDGAGWPVTSACRRCGQRGERFLHGHTATPPPKAHPVFVPVNHFLLNPSSLKSW